MNKYEIAILRLDKSYKLSSELRHDACNVLMELVKRATPSSLTFEETSIADGEDYYICNACHQGGLSNDDMFCKHCGQDITKDWED